MPKKTALEECASGPQSSIACFPSCWWRPELDSSDRHIRRAGLSLRRRRRLAVSLNGILLAARYSSFADGLSGGGAVIA
jgi:hypothetical protein